MKTLAIDYLGVICKDGQLNEGAKEALENLSQVYTVIIFTTEDQYQTEQWLKERGINLQVTNFKPIALAYIDDRAVRFTNWYDIQKMFI